MPGGAQSPASLDASRPLDEDAMARGIDLLTLYQDSVRNDPATYAYARWMTEHGGQVRTAPILPPRLLIFDRTTAVVPIGDYEDFLAGLESRYDYSEGEALPQAGRTGISYSDHYEEKGVFERLMNRLRKIEPRGSGSIR